MFRPKQLREQSEEIRASLQKRGIDTDLLDEALEIDEKRREIIEEVEEKQRYRNEESEKIGQLKAEGKDEQAEEIIQKMSSVKQEIQELDERRDELDESLRDRLMHIPNILDETVPDGETEDDNRVEERAGTPPDFNFEPRPHWEIAEDLGILNMEQSQKISGSRFFVYHGAGAQLERALIDFMLDVQTEDNGYEEAMTPVLARPETMEGTGQLPKFEEDMFQTDKDDRYLIPTAEVTLINLYRDMILEEDDLPIKKTGWTPCFRREAGAHGRDTRGLMRQHQFNKVELITITKPENSDETLHELTGHARSVLDRLELPYQVVTLCSGDTGFAASYTYDLEVWLPGQQRYREISSCSNCRGFQARRAQIQFRTEPEAPTQYCHTLNGSGIAVGRCWLALIENFQQEDGSVVIPDALRPYMNGRSKIE
ncbi:MAG: serine--tRNA ligase [bacterium]